MKFVSDDDLQFFPHHWISTGKSQAPNSISRPRSVRPRRRPQFRSGLIFKNTFTTFTTLSCTSSTSKWFIENTNKSFRKKLPHNLWVIRHNNHSKCCRCYYWFAQEIKSKKFHSCFITFLKFQKASTRVFERFKKVNWPYFSLMKNRKKMMI